MDFDEDLQIPNFETKLPLPSDKEKPDELPLSNERELFEKNLEIIQNKPQHQEKKKIISPTINQYVVLFQTCS